MLKVLRESEQQKKRAGRPSKLSLADQLLLTLMYWREYRTQFHIAKSYSIHEANANRLWRAVNEHGEVLDVLLQRTRCKEAAKRCLQRLLDEQDIPEQIVTDGLRSYGAAIHETPELGATLHITVSASERQNNLIEQSHRPTRDRERQQRGFRSLERTQRFLLTHAYVSNLFRHTRARTAAAPP